MIRCLSVAVILLGVINPADAGDPIFARTMGPTLTGPVFAAPLPYGPGQVPMMNGPLAAPVLMPLSAPTAAPVGVYLYPTGTAMVMNSDQTTATAAVCDNGQAWSAQSRLWLTADFFYGAGRSANQPPLVTGTQAGVNPNQAGIPGTPGTQVLFGGDGRLNDLRPGFRLHGGLWFDSCQKHGIDASYFFLGHQSDDFNGASPDARGFRLYRPATLAGAPFALPIGVTIGTNVVPGTIAANASTRVSGADVNYRRNLTDTGCRRVDLLLGYRYLGLSEELAVTTAQPTVIPVAGAPGLVGPTLFTEDRVQTWNDFHGGQIGLATHRTFSGCFSLDLLAKVALGATYARAEFAGTQAGAVAVNNAGFLVGTAMPVGRFDDSFFSVVPEAGVRLGYQVTSHWSVNVGYSFVYWSRVLRAGDQWSNDIVLPAAAPAFRNLRNDYWVQGITLGLEGRW